LACLRTRVRRLDGRKSDFGPVSEKPPHRRGFLFFYWNLLLRDGLGHLLPDEPDHLTQQSVGSPCPVGLAQGVSNGQYANIDSRG